MRAESRRRMLQRRNDWEGEVLAKHFIRYSKLSRL